MKQKNNIFIYISILCLLLANSVAFGQSGVMQKKDNPDNTIYELKDQFDQYWKGKKPVKGSEYKQFLRWYNFAEPRLAPSGKYYDPFKTVTDELTRLKKYEVEATAKTSNCNTASWSVIGPNLSNAPADAYVNNPHRSVSPGIGRVNFVYEHPDPDNNYLYAGAANGGLWRGLPDGTNYWTPMSNDLTSLGMGDLAIFYNASNSSDPNNGTMYLGTGDPNGGVQTLNSSGIFKSTNSGSNWTLLHSKPKEQSENYKVNRILVHPTNANIVIAGTSDGVIKSTDGGANWSMPVLPGINIIDLEFKPGTSSIIYAAPWTTSTGIPQIFKSTDTGDSFPIITSLPSVSGGSDFNGRIELATSSLQPSTVYAIAVSSDNNPISLIDGSFYGLYKSTNSGGAFICKSSSYCPSSCTVGVAPTGKTYKYAENILGNSKAQIPFNGSYIGRIALTVDPTNANADILYVGGVEINKSTDHGETWEIMNDITNSTPQTNPPTLPTYVHPDIHSFCWYGPNNHLYVGHDGGLSSSTNGGASWSKWNKYVKNMVTSECYDISAPPNTLDVIWAGTQDNGVFVYNKMDNAHKWKNMAEGDAFSVHAHSASMGYRDDIGRDISYTNNSGQGWGTKYNVPNVNSRAMLGNTINTTYLVGDDLHRKFSANAWSFLKDVTGSHPALTADMSPTSNTRLLLAQKYDDGVLTLDPPKIYELTNSESATPNLTPLYDPTAALPVGYVHLSNRTLSDLAIHPIDVNKAYATFSGYNIGEKVYYSDNGGGRWINISGEGLPNLPVNTIEVDYTGTTTRIYIGTDIGVYYTDDNLVGCGGGTTQKWIPFMKNLPKTIVNDLEMHTDGTTKKLRASTFGRGVWEVTPTTGICTCACTDLNLEQGLLITKNCNGNNVPYTSALNVATFTDLGFELEANVLNSASGVTWDWGGGVAVLAPGGDPDLGPYNVQWSTTGLKTVTVTHNGACYSKTVLVNFSPPCNINYHSSIVCSTKNPTCGTSNGNFKIYRSYGGSLCYTYNITQTSGGSYSDSGSFTSSSGTYTLSDLSAGDYTITVTDEMTGCTASVNKTLTGLLTANYTKTDLGFGLTEVVVTVTNGTAPYSYNWETSSGSSTSCGNASSCELSDGNYYVYITDANGCEKKLNVKVGTTSCGFQVVQPNTLFSCGYQIEHEVVFEYYKFSSTSGGTGILGNITHAQFRIDKYDAKVGETISGQIVARDKDGKVTYVLYKGIITLNSELSVDLRKVRFKEGVHTIGFLPDGRYAKNSFIQEHYYLNVPSSDLSINIEKVQHAKDCIDCGIGIGTGVIIVGAKGGSGKYTYTWADCAECKTPIREKLGVGTYFVKVSDERGNETVKEIKIESPVSLTFKMSDKCTKKGTIDLIAKGGSGDYEYYWYHCGDKECNESRQSNLPQGTYYAAVQDLKTGCSTFAVADLVCGKDLIRTPNNSNTDISFKNTDACNAELNLYPVPFQNQLQLNFSVEDHKEVDSTIPVSVKLYHISGKYLSTIYDGTLQNGRIQNINYQTEHLEGGVYFVTLEYCGQKITKKADKF